jgi:hypothetical protein
MGSLEANIEMVVMARNLPNDRIDFSMPGGSAREETAVTILLSKHQRAKLGEVHRQAPSFPSGLRRTNWRRKRENTASNEAWLCCMSKPNGEAGELAMGVKHSYIAWTG